MYSVACALGQGVFFGLFVGLFVFEGGGYFLLNGCGLSLPRLIELGKFTSSFPNVLVFDQNRLARVRLCRRGPLFVCAELWIAKAERL